MPHITLSLWSADVPDAPTDERLCRLYGKTADLSGRPLPFMSFRFGLLYDLSYGGVSADSVVAGEVTSTSNRDGHFYVDLPKDTEVYMNAPHMRGPVPFQTPDAGVCALTDVMFPHPIRLEWFYTDNGTLTPITESFPGFVELVSGGTVSVSLCSVWSNGQAVALTNPSYTTDGWADVSQSGGVITLTSLGKNATLTSTMESAHAGEGALWEVVGFDPGEYTPHFFPDSDYLLEDPGTLTFVPV